MGSARLSSELHASPSQSTTSPSIPSVCLHFSHCVCHHRSSGLAINSDSHSSDCPFFFLAQLQTQNKTRNEVITRQSVTQLLCTALHNSSTSSTLTLEAQKTVRAFFIYSLLFCSHRGQRGPGSITLIIVRRTTNAASWKIGLFLKPVW